MRKLLKMEEFAGVQGKMPVGRFAGEKQDSSRCSDDDQEAAPDFTQRARWLAWNPASSDMTILWDAYQLSVRADRALRDSPLMTMELS